MIHSHFYRYRRAHSFFKKALKIDSNNLTVNINLAHLYINFKRYETAEKLIKKLLVRNAKDSNLKKVLKRIETRRNEEVRFLCQSRILR